MRSVRPGGGAAAAVERAFAALARERSPVAGGVGLDTPEVDLLLGNAVWNPDPARIGTLTRWCEARGMPPAAVIQGPDAPAADALAARGYRREAAWRLASLLPASAGAGAARRPAAPVGSGPVLEQTGWPGARAAADVLSRSVGRSAQGAGLAIALARGLRRQEGLALGSAYPLGGPAAAGPVGAALWSLASPADAASAAVLVWAAGARAGWVAWARDLVGAGPPLFALRPTTAPRGRAALERWSRGGRRRLG